MLRDSLSDDVVDGPSEIGWGGASTKVGCKSNELYMFVTTEVS